MIKYGLIGYPLGHSLSQQFFTEKFAREGIADSRYDLYPLPDIRDFPNLLKEYPELRGLNVTIPHKETVIPYLQALDETARVIGAVNVIRIREGQCTGFNTDALGFEKSLLHLEGGRWLQPDGRAALILGTGGASKAVAYVLAKHGIPFRFVSRKPSAENHISYASLRTLDFGPIRAIFNATHVGTFPEIEKCPDLPYEKIHSAQLVYDLIYNPAETLLLQRAKARGAAVKNGEEMWQEQAKAAWAVWQAF